MSDENSVLFRGYALPGARDVPIVTAPRDRDWMAESREQSFDKCLPILLANQAGWIMKNPVTFRAVWNGHPDPYHLLIVFEGDTPDDRVCSQLGCGVLTFRIPYLFQTPPGLDLWVKGPSNYIKDGAQPVESMVEADHAPLRLDMHWKLTRYKKAVRFEKGEPICMIVPVSRGLAEGLKPRLLPPDGNAQIQNTGTTAEEISTPGFQRTELHLKGFSRTIHVGPRQAKPQS